MSYIYSMTIGENRRTLEGTQFFIGWGESGGGGGGGGEVRRTGTELHCTY